MSLRIALDVRLEQIADPVGVLVASDDAAVRFAYHPAYVATPGAVPISLSLPLRDEPFGDREARPFFQNLLPENNQLEAVIAREGLARDDVAGLLFHLGADCPGALSCLPSGSPPAKNPGRLDRDYRELPAEEIEDIVSRLANRDRLPQTVRDPSPVAGVQQKIALLAYPDGRFALPIAGSGAPTTHILKVPFRTHGREALLEQAASQLAQACGLDVSVPKAIQVGAHDALLIERFDRRITPDGEVLRLHQEDFVQALGLPPLLKYERNGAPGRRLDAEAIAVLLDKTAEPALARLAFIQSVMFNLLIGNVDNHGKNHALLYDRGPRPRLAPLYDLQPTKLDRELTSDFAFRLGEATDLKSLTAIDLVRFLKVFGLTDAAVPRFMVDQLAPMIERLEVAAPQIPHRLKDFDDLLGRETEQLVDTLELGLPVRPRDSFAAD
jgi:serine/threonine-protein kinase HipA